MVSVRGINVEPVRNLLREAGVGTGFLVLIATSAAFQFYKQWVLRQTEPVAFAAMSKTSMGIAYLVFAAGKSVTKTGVAPLFDHQRHIAPCWLATFIAVLCLLGAATLVLDTLAFVYLDLATKQVIDSAGPVAVLVTAPVLSRLLENCQPVNYIIFDDDDLEDIRHKPRWRLVQWIQVFCVCAMVVASVFVVWVTPNVSFTGVAINAITLVTSSVALVMLETILKWGAYSKFGLMVVTILPEIAVLGVVSAALGEDYPSRLFVLYAAAVGLVEVALKVVAFYLLRAAGSVELSVSGVMVFAIVVTLDTVRTGKAGAMRVAGLVATGVFLAGYTIMGYAWRRKELQIRPGRVSGPEVGDGEGLPFDDTSSSLEGLGSRAEMAGFVPSGRDVPH